MTTDIFFEIHDGFSFYLGKGAPRKGQVHETGLDMLPVRGSMLHLGFVKESFDIIWAEEAIYIMGFEKGLREWHRSIRPGGFPGGP